jgi:hypothetical protein
MITNSDTTFGRAVGDRLLGRYDSWRQECASVERAYEAWTSSDRAGRKVAYAGYLAALDQEELAAAAYRDELARARKRSR